MAVAVLEDGPNLPIREDILDAPNTNQKAVRNSLDTMTYTMNIDEILRTHKLTQ